jgi:pimeloyl-ACP methyl ester carboxylesterase
MNTDPRVLRSLLAVGSVIAPRRTVARALEVFRTPTRHEPREWELLVEASATRAWTSSGISHLRWTPSRVEARAIAVHGWEGRATQWGPMAREMLTHCVEVVAIDAPAHGETDGMHADPLVFAEAIHSTVDELGPFDFALGHSMGGGAVALALSQGLKVDKAVLIASPAAFADVAMRFARHVGMPKRMHSDFLAAIGDAAGMAIEDADITRLVSTLDIPGLVVHDRSDDDTPCADAERITAAWPRGSILLTEGLGHRRLLRDPGVIDEIIDFLVD